LWNISFVAYLNFDARTSQKLFCCWHIAPHRSIVKRSQSVVVDFIHFGAMLNQLHEVHQKYSQTWSNNHLRIATTCLQRPLFWGPNETFYNINDLRTMAACQQRPLFLGPEVGRCTQVWLYISSIMLNQLHELHQTYLSNIILDQLLWQIINKLYMSTEI